jgi:catalase
MSDKNSHLRRRTLLSSAGGLSLAGILAPAAVSATTSQYATDPPSVADLPESAIDGVTGRELVYSLEQAYGVYKGQRRNHTKGVGALGSFVGTQEATAYSCSTMFSGQPVEVVARFSLAGGNAHSSDKERSARGMALEFRLPNGHLQHMTMLHTPMFFAAVPRTFFDKFVSLTPDPDTGKPNPARYKAFVSSHPDTNSQNHFLADENPPPNYANSAFFGIHSFKFVNAEMRTTIVRWRFVPHDGVKHLSDEELKSMPADFLEQALIQRVKSHPVKWDMIVTIGQPGDPEDDPTVLWPQDRKEFRAGTLTVTSAMPQEDAASYSINYDPLVMADGIAATNDPILQARSSSYGVSHSRRLRGI